MASEVALQHKTARGATLARLRPRAELAHRSKRLGSLGPSRRVPTLGPTSAKKAQVLGRRRSKVDHFLFSSEQGAGLFSSRRSRPCFAAHSSRPVVLGLPTAGRTGARGWQGTAEEAEEEEEEVTKEAGGVVAGRRGRRLQQRLKTAPRQPRGSSTAVTGNRDGGAAAGQARDSATGTSPRWTLAHAPHGMQAQCTA